MTATAAPCDGDCNRDGQVTVNELITAVNIALGTLDVSSCPAADRNGDGEVTVSELIRAVNRALVGC
jgi:Ca2+-binding EF-hand superfamily protein